MRDAHKAAGELEALAKELLGKIEDANSAVDESATDWPVLSPFEIQQYRQRIAEICHRDPILESGRDVTAELAPAMERIAEKLAAEQRPSPVRLWPTR